MNKRRPFKTFVANITHNEEENVIGIEIPYYEVYIEFSDYSLFGEWVDVVQTHLLDEGAVGREEYAMLMDALHEYYYKLGAKKYADGLVMH